MKRRKWQPDEKLAIVLEGLNSESSVQEICRRHNVSQTQYYKWRDQFFRGAREYFQYGGNNGESYELKHRIQELKRIIGKQTIQIEILKKVEEMAKNLLKEDYKPADISRALDISRSNCYISAQSTVNQKFEDFHIVKHIRAIAAQHPFWGYRRITAWLKHREGEFINHKKVYSLMNEHKLLVPRSQNPVEKSHKANRTPQKGKPKPERPGEWWGIDMTKFLLPRLVHRILRS